MKYQYTKCKNFLIKRSKFNNVSSNNNYIFLLRFFVSIYKYEYYSNIFFNASIRNQFNFFYPHRGSRKIRGTLTIKKIFFLFFSLFRNWINLLRNLKRGRRLSQKYKKKLVKLRNIKVKDKQKKKNNNIWLTKCLLVCPDNIAGKNISIHRK